MKKFLKTFCLFLLMFSFTFLAYGANEIKIGVIYPLTGPAASTGQVLLDGVKLAVDIINNKHNLNMPLAKTEGLPNLKGAKIVIVPGDHQSNPATGMAEAERLITQEKVVAILGCYNSNVTATASQAAERYSTPFVNESSTSPTLTERGFKWFFRTTPHDDLLSENFFHFLNDLKKKKNIDPNPIAIFNENTLFGTDSAKFQDKYAKQYGYRVSGMVPYPPKSTQLTSEVQKLKGYNPKVILQTSYIADAILSMKTYKELNFTPDAILANNAGFIDPEFVRTLGKDANYILSREVWAKDLATKKPMIKTVADMFQKRSGKPMDGSSSRAFTAMIVLADAINRAGSTEPAKIQKALLETNIKPDQLVMPWDGVKFDPKTHQNLLGKGIIVQVQNGEYYTVWPFDLATKDVIWPFPKWDKR
ncbi:MAG: ABC transporter substrate-binding protein [Proteobacteria bacterium]|nr:ABC transporter substrate-binding protein [Pseudomonadota bacterium]